jgi:hypothetical protein
MPLFAAPVWTREQRALLTTLSIALRARRGLESMEQRDRLALALGNDAFSWSDFVAFTRRHRVVPLVHEVLREHGGTSVPGAVRTELRDEARRLFVFAEASFQRLKTLSASLASLGIPHAAYKGPALALQAYGAVGTRTFGDLDVLVPRRDLERVVAWAQGASYTLPEWDDRELRAWTLAHMHHLSAFRKSGFGDAHLELHWMTLPPMMRPGTPTIDAWLDEPLESVDGVPVLPWPRAWAANAEHHAKHGFSRLMLLVDCAVRPVPLPMIDPVLADDLGRSVLAATVAMADALTNDTLLDDAPELLLRTWHADDPYQFEVGEAYLDLLDPRGSWARRRIRFESIARSASAKDAAYGVARQAFLEANVAAGRVFGARPNARSPLLARARALFR